MTGYDHSLLPAKSDCVGQTSGLRGPRFAWRLGRWWASCKTLRPPPAI